MDYQNIFNQDFYPTPENVIADMLKMSDIQGKIILEPSAGVGNIVDYLQKAGAKEVIACEINDKFRAVLSGKCEIVGDDFLSLAKERISHIDMIVMNPPFSMAKDHILHAWEIAPDGCEIISLCNSGTLGCGMSYSKNQKICELVEEFGSSERLGEAFTSAERKTNVDVSCIRLYKPKKDEFEFDDYFTDEADEPEYAGNGLISYNFVRDCVNRYVAAVQRFDSVMEAANEINGLLDGIGSRTIRFGAMSGNYGSEKWTNITRNQFKKQAQKDAWHWLFNKFNMDKYVTQQVRDNINKFVELQQNVKFTMRNIYKMVELIYLNRENFFKQALCEAFDKICSFSSENSTAGEKWKTNSNYMVNRRFIIPNMCNYYNWRPGEVNISYSGMMDDVLKALCNLTGLNYDDFPKLYSIDDSMRWGEWYDWGYFDKKQSYDNSGKPVELVGDWHPGIFRIRCYKKGTMHVEFVDEDVWYKFNQEVAKIRGWNLPQKSNASKKAERKSKNQDCNQVALDLVS